jgi:hypothetical protein
MNAGPLILFMEVELVVSLSSFFSPEDEPEPEPESDTWPQPPEGPPAPLPLAPWDLALQPLVYQARPSWYTDPWDMLEGMISDVTGRYLEVMNK